MIKFRQKTFTEYDAMRSLYIEIMKFTNNDRNNRFPVIDKSAVLPILKGNNIVVEKFVISTSLFGRDRYRMYLKIGAKAKLPDEVRLPARYYDVKLGDISLEFSGKIGQQKEFGKNSKGNGNNNNNNEAKFMTSGFKFPNVYINRTVKELLGEAVSYNKKDRSLVLEFTDIRKAIEALNILPFGIDYKIYLLNS